MQECLSTGMLQCEMSVYEASLAKVFQHSSFHVLYALIHHSCFCKWAGFLLFCLIDNHSEPCCCEVNGLKKFREIFLTWELC